MEKLTTSNKIYVSKSTIPNAGRGVFARVDIKRGETIESCPVVEIPKDDLALLSESILISYFYFFGKNKERVFLVLGFGSIYNHSYEPNAVYKENLKNGLVNFVTLKTIKKGEEITVNYDPENGKSGRSLWFYAEGS